LYFDILKEPSEISNHDASGCFTSVAGSFKWEFWLYEVNKQIFIEKLETVDWITLLCPFVDVDGMCNQITKIFLELVSLLIIYTYIRVSMIFLAFLCGVGP
jgi:hypothetical protein